MRYPQNSGGQPRFLCQGHRSTCSLLITCALPEKAEEGSIWKVEERPRWQVKEAPSHSRQPFARPEGRRPELISRAQNRFLPFFKAQGSLRGAEDICCFFPCRRPSPHTANHVPALGRSSWKRTVTSQPLRGLSRVLMLREETARACEDSTEV